MFRLMKKSNESLLSRETKIVEGFESGSEYSPLHSKKRLTYLRSSQKRNDKSKKKYTNELP